MQKVNAILVCSLVIALCLPLFALTNLVVNPGFEQGLTVGWRGSGNATLDTDAKSGSKALKIISGTGGAVIYQNIPVIAGKVYTISGWIKQEGDRGPSDAVSYLYYWYFDTPTLTSSTKTLHNQYIEYVSTGPYQLTKNYSLAPVGAAVLRIELHVGGTPEGYNTICHFDDLSVVEDEYITNQTNILVNPDFENGTTGWTSNVGGTATTTTEMKHKGSSSLKINNNGNWAEMYQMVQAAPGDGFGFEGYACLRTLAGDSAMDLNPPPGPSAFLQFSYVSATDTHPIDLGYYNFATWHKWAMETRVAPPGTTGLWVNCWVFQGGPYLGYFDDFKLIKFTKNPTPPGITPLSLARVRSKSDLSEAAYDILGRRIAGPLQSTLPHSRKPDRIANGAYIYLEKSSRSSTRTANLNK